MTPAEQLLQTILSLESRVSRYRTAAAVQTVKNAQLVAINHALQTIRSTTLDEIAVWLDGFEFPEAKPLAKQARIMAKDAIEEQS